MSGPPETLRNMLPIMLSIVTLINAYLLHKQSKQNRALRLQIDEYRLEIERRNRLDNDNRPINMSEVGDLESGVPLETPDWWPRPEEMDSTEPDEMQVHTLLNEQDLDLVAGSSAQPT